MEIDFFESGLMMVCDDAKISFGEIGRFHELTEESWKQKDEELQYYISERLANVPKQHHDEFISDFGEDLHENQILFPSIHRASIVISISSYFEDYLNQIAEMFENSVPSSKKYKNFQRDFKQKRKGSTIACAKDYLTEVGKLDFTSIESIWKQIQQINQLRNQLVHEAGYLPNSSSHKLNQYVNGNEYLSGKANSKVTIKSGFISSYIDLILAFFDKLDREIIKFMRA